MKSALSAISLMLLICLTASCSSRSSLQTRLIANANTNVCSLAVMPFENWTRKPTLSQMATQVFTSELIAQKTYTVIQPGELGRFRLQRRIMPGDLLMPDDYASLVSQLGADAVVQGRVVEEGAVPAQRGAPTPYLVLQIDLYDARTGKLLANSVHRRKGEDYRTLLHFGVVTTTSGLAQKMCREIIGDWKSKGVICQ